MRFWMGGEIFRFFEPFHSKARTEPPRPAKLLRELIHMGQMVQSHGMHFFHRAASDLGLGFDADPAVEYILRLIR